MDDLKKIIRSAIDSGETSVAKLAEATKLSRMQIYRIMDGENAPSLSTAEAIAKALGLRVSFTPQKKVSKSA